MHRQGLDVDLATLTESERDAILSVLDRDAKLRLMDQDHLL